MSFIKKCFSFFFDRSLLPFLIIGSFNTIVTQIGCQLFLNSLGYWGSSALMFFLCSFTSFVLNRKYSFHSQAPLLQSIVRFAVVITACYIPSFAISDLVAPFICTVLFPALPEEWVARVALLFAQIVFTGFNYLGQRLWAFKN